MTTCPHCQDWLVPRFDGRLVCLGCHWVASSPATAEPPTDIEPCDPNVDPRDAGRLSDQCRTILALLQDRPRSNVELAAVGLKYTSRISDLRKAGCRIEAKRNGATWTYTLKEKS